MAQPTPVRGGYMATIEFVTNLSEEDLYNVYLDMMDNCEKCKMAHYACRVPRWDCSKCEWFRYVRALKNHFEN